MFYKIFCNILIILLFLFNIPAQALKLQKANFSSLPDFNKSSMKNVLPALKLSCSDLLTRAKYHNYKSDIRYQKKYLNTCEKIVNLSKSYLNSDIKIKQFFISNYNPYLVLDENSSSIGVFTGYYQPSIQGGLTRTKKFDVPIYAMPSYTKNLPDRESISKGPILKNTPILAWVESKIERFFLQVQGSGTIILPDNKMLLLGYNGQNGHPYYPIGRYLVENGYVPKSKISMQSIVSWLKAHPGESQKVMNLNPSFVFFKVLDQESPNGAQGLPLTPEVSIAVDREYIPLGSLLYLSTNTPKLNNGHIIKGEKLNKFMVAQDTGGAIKGSIRGDVFWGLGDRAKFLAGHMNSKGKYWMLIPKGVIL